MLTSEAKLRLRTFMMDSLRSDTLNAIEYALHRSMQQCSDDGLRSQTEVQSTINDINRTVYSAISDFSVQWNARTRRPIDSLPAEILLKCFGWLSLRDRLAISRVSHPWRTLAVGHQVLWATAVVRSPLQLKFILEHSQSSTLRIFIAEVDFGYVMYMRLVPYLRQVVSLHVHKDKGHLEFFTVWPEISLMPNLLELRLSSSSFFRTSLDPKWAGIAPKLETLSVEFLRFDETLGAPFRHVTTLETTIHSDNGIPNLWKIFPKVQKIVLKMGATQQLAAAGKPPASLHEVSLDILVQRTNSSEPRPRYSVILDSWETTCLSTATFTRPYGERQLLMQYFIQSHHRSWTLRWAVLNPNIYPLFDPALRSHSVQFIIPTEDVSHTPLFVITLEHRSTFDVEAIREVYYSWSRLTALEVHDSLFASFIELDIELPEVTRLALIATGHATRIHRRHINRIRKTVANLKASGVDVEMPMLRLPALEVVEFRCMGWPGSTPWPSWYIDHVRAFLCKHFPVGLEQHVHKDNFELKRVTFMLIHQVLDVAVEQRWDFRSRLEHIAAEIRVEREPIGFEPEAREILDNYQLFVPSLYT